MPFWFVKLSVSPASSVPGEMATVAPVKSVSAELTITDGSTATADPPISNVC